MFVLNDDGVVFTSRKIVSIYISIKFKKKYLKNNMRNWIHIKMEPCNLDPWFLFQLVIHRFVVKVIINLLQIIMGTLFFGGKRICFNNNNIVPMTIAIINRLGWMIQNGRSLAKRPLDIK